jgi:hypothetical protein
VAGGDDQIEAVIVEGKEINSDQNLEAPVPETQIDTPMYVAPTELEVRNGSMPSNENQQGQGPAFVPKIEINLDEVDNPPPHNISSTASLDQRIREDMPSLDERITEYIPGIHKRSIDLESTLSTRDSRSPSIGRQSPMHQESLSPSLSRRITFGGMGLQQMSRTPSTRRSSTADRKSPYSGNGHIPVTFGSSSTIPLAKRLREAPININMDANPPNRLHWSSTPRQRFAVQGRPVFTNVSMPATVLLANSYEGWSNFCVALGNDGNIDLLDSRTHKPLPRSRILKDIYTATSAINGTWLSPGELALVHRDPRINRDGTQITLVKYMDLQMSILPTSSQLKRSPHSRESKITAITALWTKSDGGRSFATAGSCTYY